MRFATANAVYANKADHMLNLPIYLNQVLTNEKSEKSEKAILTPSSGPQRNLKLFFGANSKSKIVSSVHCAYASIDKMVRTLGYLSGQHLKKLIFYFIPEVPYL
jgi:hypothetical protein